MTITVWVQTCFTYFKSNYQLQIIFTEILFSALDADFTKATDNRLKYVYRSPPKILERSYVTYMVLRYRIMLVVFTIVVTDAKGSNIIGPNHVAS